MDAPGPAGLTPFAEQLREAGLRATRPRLLVLELLGRLGGHRSADDITDALQAQGTPISRTSVYNVLNDLSDQGLVMVADAGPGRALYESGRDWHHHFVCRSCERIVDVPCREGTKPCLEPDADGIFVDEAQVIFRGLCVECSG